MAEAAGRAVSSAQMTIRSASAGGRKRIAVLSATAGPSRTTRSPGRRAAAQREAGPAGWRRRVPCRAGRSRCRSRWWRRRVPAQGAQGVRAHDRADVFGGVDPGLAPAVAVLHRQTGVCWPGRGRKSERLWSWPSEAKAWRSGPVKVTRTRDGLSRLVRVTWRVKKRNGAATPSAWFLLLSCVRGRALRGAGGGRGRVQGLGWRGSSRSWVAPVPAPSRAAGQATFLAFSIASARLLSMGAHLS